MFSARYVYVCRNYLCSFQEAQRAQKAANKEAGLPNKQSGGKSVETTQAKLDTGTQSTRSLNSKNILDVKGHSGGPNTTNKGQSVGGAGGPNTTSVKGQSGGGAGGPNTTSVKGPSVGNGGGTNTINKKQDQPLAAVTGNLLDFAVFFY